MPVVRGGGELVPLDLVVQAWARPRRLGDPAGCPSTLTYEGREVVLYHGKSLASVGGDLRLLSSPALYEDGHWLVPVDSCRAARARCSERVEWRAAVARAGRRQRPGAEGRR